MGKSWIPKKRNQKDQQPVLLIYPNQVLHYTNLQNLQHLEKEDTKRQHSSPPSQFLCHLQCGLHSSRVDLVYLVPFTGLGLTLPVVRHLGPTFRTGIWRSMMFV
jgi:hypothetical protein